MKHPAQPMTDDQKQMVCTLLAAGMTRRTAVKRAGSRMADMRAEMAQDAAFLERVRQCELRVEIEAMRTMITAARDSKQWRAAAWILERLYPRRYGASRREAVATAELQRFLKEHSPTLARQALSLRRKSRKTPAKQWTD